MKLDSVTLLFGLCASAIAAPANVATEQDLTRRQFRGGGGTNPFAPSQNNNPFQNSRNPPPTNPFNGPPPQQGPVNPFGQNGQQPQGPQYGNNAPPPFPQDNRPPPPQNNGSPPFPQNNGPPPRPQSNGPPPRPQNSPPRGNPFGPKQSQPPSSQGPPAIEGAIKSTGQALEALYNELKGWNRLPKGQESNAVKHAYDLQDQVLRLMRQGSQDIRRGPNVASAEANRLRDWLGAVTDLFSDSMDQWIDYKRHVVTARARPNVYQQLRDVQTALTEWNRALVSRLPTLSTIFQSQWTARQTRQIERAVLEYRSD